MKLAVEYVNQFGVKRQVRGKGQKLLETRDTARQQLLKYLGFIWSRAVPESWCRYGSERKIELADGSDYNYLLKRMTKTIRKILFDNKEYLLFRPEEGTEVRVKLPDSNGILLFVPLRHPDHFTVVLLHIM